MNTVLAAAIKTVKTSELSFCKFISPNDAGETGGHQDGFYIPKNSVSLLFDEPGVKGENKEKWVTIKWSDETTTQSRFIYYGRGSRNEYRITRLGRSFKVEDLFILSKIQEDEYHAFVISEKPEIDFFLKEFGIDSSQTNNLIPKFGIEDTDENADSDLDDTEDISDVQEGEELVSFNPKDIDIVVEQRSLDSLIKRLRYGNINLNTEFQRKGNLWSASTMSKLIESVMIRFPLPSFYFDASEDENWLVVDGLQRLHTFMKFMIDDKPMKLTGLEFLKEYEGFTYDMLPGSMKRRIEEAQVTTYLIKPGTPSQVKYSVFHRINTGGLILNAQEIRHALNQGKATRFLVETTESQGFKKAVKISNKRMQDRELVLRFVAFSLNSYEGYVPPMLHFLNRVMEDMNKLPTSTLTALGNNLSSALELSTELFGKDIFSKSIVDSSRPVINRALFETWTVVLAKLSPPEQQIIRENKAKLLLEYKALFSDQKFFRSITDSTTGRIQVLERFSGIEQLVKNILRS